MSAPLVSILIGLLTFLCLISAVLSALETALLCLKEHQAKPLAHENQSLHKALQLFSRQPERQLNYVLLLGSTLHLMIAAIALALLNNGALPWGLPPWLTALILFSAIVVAIELIPTLVAQIQPAAVFRLTARTLLLVNPPLDPVAAVLSRITDRFVAILIPKTMQPRSAVTEEEIKTLVELRHEQGILQESEREMIQEILKLRHKTAKDCMTPRVDATVMSTELSPEESDRFIRGNHHRRIPVYRDSPDAVVGVLDVKAYLLSGRSDSREFIQTPVFVPETMRALDVFKDYLQSPHSLVVVLDEFGQMEGVMNQGDLIEEILSDAAPQPEQALEIQDLGKNRLLVAGSARLDEIGELLDVDLEHEGLDTIGGLLFTSEDRLPSPGEKIRLNGIVATVRRCSARRIEEILIEKPEGGPPANRDDASTASPTPTRDSAA